MKRIRRLLVVVTVVLAVHVPAAAFASDTCQAIQEELNRYGWHTPICPSTPLD